MNIREKELSAWMDGALSPERMADVEAAIQTDPELRKQAEALRGLRDAVRASDHEVPAVTAEQMVQDIRRVLRREQAGRKSWAASAWLRAGALVTACLVLTLVFLPQAEVEFTEIKYVESDLSDVSTMVYTDHEAGWTVVWLDGVELESVDES